jgi:hypothetical protein
MARKRAAPKKRAPTPTSVKVDIDLGPVKATPAQIARLKAYVGNQLLTWIKADLKEDNSPPIVCEEFHKPPRPGPGDEADN